MRECSLQKGRKRTRAGKEEGTPHGRGLGADLDLTPWGASEHVLHHRAGPLFRQRGGVSDPCVGQSLSLSSLEKGWWKLNLLDDVALFGWMPINFAHNPGAIKWKEEAKRAF